MVAGEESKEAEDQEHREKRVLEAVYPSRSAIPSKYVKIGLISWVYSFFVSIYLVVIPFFPIGI